MEDPRWVRKNEEQAERERKIAQIIAESVEEAGTQVPEVPARLPLPLPSPGQQTDTPRLALTRNMHTDAEAHSLCPLIHGFAL